MHKLTIKSGASNFLMGIIPGCSAGRSCARYKSENKKVSKSVWSELSDSENIVYYLPGNLMNNQIFSAKDF